MLSVSQKRKLAEEAWKLADECSRGSGPRLVANFPFVDGKPCCVLGHLYARAGLRSDHYYYGGGLPGSRELATANDSAPSADRQQIVAPYLRNLARAIEESVPEKQILTSDKGE